MLVESNFEDYVFFDIETAPLAPSLEEYTPDLKAAWYRTFWDNNEKNQARYSTVEDCFWGETSLRPEFSQVVCVCGMRLKDKKRSGKCWAVTEKCTEKELLLGFIAYCGSSFLAGKTIKRFDIPFLSKRMCINGIVPPRPLNTFNQKPWEVNHQDADDLWAFGSSTPSNLMTMCACLGIPSPKDDIDGSEVGKLFFSKEPDAIERIKTYCAKDVFATINVMRRICGLPLVV